MEITQVLTTSPPHDTNTPAEAITIKDFLDTTPQKINPLTTEDLKKILDQSTQQPKLCENIVLVNVEEYQKVVTNTSAQPLVQKTDDTSTKFDTQTTPKWILEVQVGQIDQGKDEDKYTPKEEEQPAIQALVNLPSADTPTKSL